MQEAKTTDGKMRLFTLPGNRLILEYCGCGRDAKGNQILLHSSLQYPGNVMHSDSFKNLVRDIEDHQDEYYERHFAAQVKDGNDEAAIRTSS